MRCSYIRINCVSIRDGTVLGWGVGYCWTFRARIRTDDGFVHPGDFVRAALQVTVGSWYKMLRKNVVTNTCSVSADGSLGMVIYRYAPMTSSHATCSADRDSIVQGNGSVYY
jgi:hypothetical protein